MTERELMKTMAYLFPILATSPCHWYLHHHPNFIITTDITTYITTYLLGPSIRSTEDSTSLHSSCAFYRNRMRTLGSGTSFIFHFAFLDKLTIRKIKYLQIVLPELSKLCVVSDPEAPGTDIEISTTQLIPVPKHLHLGIFCIHLSFVLVSEKVSEVLITPG